MALEFQNYHFNDIYSVEVQKLQIRLKYEKSFFALSFIVRMRVDSKRRISAFWHNLFRKSALRMRPNDTWKRLA